MIRIIAFAAVLLNCLCAFLNLTDGSGVNLAVGVLNLFAVCFLSFMLGVTR